MIFLNLICCSLAVALVRADLVRDHDLNEYRLATKRHHRKIRSTESEDFVPLLTAGEAKQEPDALIPPSGSELDESSSQVAPNTSFLLDLPYPSHFLVSLQMLNLSLPFIDTTVVNVPEDPPTPKFDLDEVIKSRQQFQASPPDENPAINPGGDKSGVNLERGPKRRAINRVRHRIPARRLPKRSPQESPPPVNIQAPKFRSWNASKPAVGSRRLELYSKYRSTTTARPKIKKFQSKLLSRRANATKHEIRTKPPPVIELPVESTTESPSAAVEQGDNSTEQPESSDLVRPSVSGTSNRFVFQSPVDFEAFKTRTGGFRPIKTSINSDRFQPSVGPDRSGPSAPREKFISSPPQSFVPILPSGQSHDIVTTTESIAGKFEFKPSAPLKPHRLSKFSSQFNPASKKQEGRSHSGDEEATQIQKPDTKHIDVISHSGSKDESLVAATSTTVPFTDFVPDFNFPSFELPSKDGKKSTAPATLPPPLSIEELIKKFTGKDLIIDPPSIVSSPTSSTPSPSVQHPSPIQAESIDIVTTKTINASPSIPQLGSLGDLEASLKQLLVVTATVPVHNNSQSSFIPFDVPKVTTPTPPSTTSTPPTTSSPPTSSSFSLPVLPLPNVSPATEKTVFSHPETPTVESVTKSPSVASGSELNKSAGISIVSIVNATSVSSDSTKLPVSVQRGPLDVSSFDNSFGVGAVQQGGFNFQSGFQQQQQPLPAGNFGGYSGGNFGGVGGGGGDVAGQQNPYFYGANLFTGPGGGGGGGAGQFNQNGFDGTLHYSPTGPPAGQFNAITQGLSLLASFGGPGGGQFAIQQPSGYQQSFSDFNPASLQASSQIQSTVPSQGFSSFSQGYPSFNLIQQQSQPYPAQSQQGYQLAQFQNYAPQPQQFYSPGGGGGQQQPFQLVGGNSPSNLYPAQLVQYQPQGSVFQQQPSGSVSVPQSPVSSAGPSAINPAQFGTLASGFQTSSFDSSGQTVGTASASPVSASSSGSNSISSSSSATAAAESPKEKSIDAAASHQVEFQLKPVSHSMFADTVAEASNSVHLISIGPENSRTDFDLLKAGSKKSSYKRGLRSGYYP